MAWRPGPPPPGLIFGDYDTRDPWTQRFISKKDDGELALDVDAMNGRETAAGAVFVGLIRQQAERPVSPAGSSLSSWMPGYDMGRRYQQHPQAMTVDPPMAQYEPFRRTYVSDPACVPQLRFAHVSDSGADHDMREAKYHWRLAGRTWSRVPRFRKGETAFTHDPNYKPPQAAVDKWYRTDTGSKNSLVGRVQESRWQSCHSMQSGRVPRKPSKSRLSLEQKRVVPGPGSYNIRDPWEVREVCGAVPKSPMFCKPVRRLRPRTAIFTPAPCGSSDMSMVTSERSVYTGDDAADVGPHESRERPATVATTTSANSGATGDTAASYASFHCTSSPRRTQRGVANGGGGGIRVENSPGPTPGAHRRGHSSAPARRRAAERARPAVVGPASFARAERSYVTEECERREESYGKKVVRLLTSNGDVVVTVNRRRASVWGDRGPFDPRSSSPGAIAPVGNNESEAGKVRGCCVRQGEEIGNHRSKAGGRSSCSSPGSRNREDRDGKDGNALWHVKATIARQGPAATQSDSSATKRGSTLEPKAMRLLPGNLAASRKVYREPGRAELPLIFQAMSAPLTRVMPSETPRVTGIIRRRNVARTGGRDVATSLAGSTFGDGGGGGADAPMLAIGGGSDSPLLSTGVGEWDKDEDEEARVEGIVSRAEVAVAKSGGAGAGGCAGGVGCGGGGGGGGAARIFA